MRGGPQAIGIRLLCAAMPELEKAERQIAAQITNKPMAQASFIAVFSHEQPVMVLVVPTRDQFSDSLVADDVQPIRAVDAVLLKVRMIENDAPEIIRQHNVGIHVHPPAVVLEMIEAGVYGRALVERAPVFEKQIRLDAESAMLQRQLLCRPVCVRGHHDHRIKMAVVPLQRNLQQIIEADRGDNHFQPQRLALLLVMVPLVMVMDAHGRL